MNPTQEKPKREKKSKTIAVRPETRNEVFKILNSLNDDENRGRLVKPDDIISLAITRLSSTDMKNILDATLTNEDRLERKFKKYCATNGPVSKDEFLGKLLGNALFEEEN